MMVSGGIFLILNSPYHFILVQGFCLRGDQCPFDHGSDPFVLERGVEFPPPSIGGTYPIGGPQDIPARSFLRPPPPIRPTFGNGK